MIFGLFHEGSGLGDQLFRYITVRTLAEKKGYQWGMWQPENFKGVEFMPLDMGLSVETNMEYLQFRESDIRTNGDDVRSYDPEINFVQDWTCVDGSFEDDKYWRQNLATIDTWLKTELLEVSDVTCCIGFRGGEYAAVPELFLGQEYWNTALTFMEGKHLEVHTDDPQLAKTFFPSAHVIPNVPLSHSKHSNMGFNWRSMRNAKFAIIPNSAFFILPRLLKHQEDPTAVTIAPRYWAGRNTKKWKRPACYYPEFTYV